MNEKENKYFPTNNLKHVRLIRQIDGKVIKILNID
jgi:hypothetical protein